MFTSSKCTSSGLISDRLTSVVFISTELNASESTVELSEHPTRTKAPIAKPERPSKTGQVITYKEYRHRLANFIGLKNIT
jgi:hypothetical protein